MVSILQIKAHGELSAQISRSGAKILLSYMLYKTYLPFCQHWKAPGDLGQQMRMKCLQQIFHSRNDSSVTQHFEVHTGGHWVHSERYDHQAEVHSQVPDKKDRVTLEGVHSSSCIGWLRLVSALMSTSPLDRAGMAPELQLVSKDSA